MLLLLLKARIYFVQGLTFAEAAKCQPQAWTALCADKEVPGAESYAAVEARASKGV